MYIFGCGADDFARLLTKLISDVHCKNFVSPLMLITGCVNW